MSKKKHEISMCCQLVTKLPKAESNDNVHSIKPQRNISDLFYDSLVFSLKFVARALR